MIRVQAICDGCGMTGPCVDKSQWDGTQRELIAEAAEAAGWRVVNMGAERFLVCHYCRFTAFDILLDRRLRVFPDEAVAQHSTPSGNGNYGGNLRPPVRWSWDLERRTG